jgi:hypothetical protein
LIVWNGFTKHPTHNILCRKNTAIVSGHTDINVSKDMFGSLKSGFFVTGNPPFQQEDTLKALFKRCENVNFPIIAGSLEMHVPYGDVCQCGCGGGIGAVTGCDVLVTAACSNWGCTAIVAAMAARAGKAALMHTPEREAQLFG